MGRSLIAVGWLALLATGCGEVVPMPAGESDSGAVQSDAGGGVDAGTPTDTAVLPLDTGVAVDAEAPVDVATPPADAEPATTTVVEVVRSAPVYDAEVVWYGRGLLIAWAAGGREGIRIQSFDEALRPRGYPLTIGWLSDINDVSLSLATTASTAAVAVGSHLYTVGINADETLRMVGDVDLGASSARGVAVRSDSLFQVVMADGRFVVTNGARTSENTPNMPLVSPHEGRGAVSFDDSGYTAFDPQSMSRGEGLRRRRFIFGHGASLEVANDAVDDRSVSPAVEIAGTVYRLIQRGNREPDVLLEARDAESFALRREPTLLQAQAGWNLLDGALSRNAPFPFMVWTSKPEGGGFNSVLTVSWSADGRVREALRDERNGALRVFSADAPPRGREAWVLFGATTRGVPLELRAMRVTQPVP